MKDANRNASATSIKVRQWSPEPTCVVQRAQGGRTDINLRRSLFDSVLLPTLCHEVAMSNETTHDRRGQSSIRKTMSDRAP